MIAEVLVELGARNIDRTFDYLVPSDLYEDIKIGIRVLVPFGRQEVEGFVLALKEETLHEELKTIIRLVDQEVILNEELRQLGKYISDTTLSTLIASYQVMLPKAVKASKKTTINKKETIYFSLAKPLKLILTEEKITPSQEAILEYLKTHPKAEKKELASISTSSVKTLLKKGIIVENKEEKYRLASSYSLTEKKPLTKRQQEVVNEIMSFQNENKVFLLHGVTGSGKTEVYMELIEKMKEEGKSSIVLVPEISLTEQIVSRFRSRFGEDIAILHSRLSDGEKYDEWRKINRQEVSIVIGARSAIFAPLKNIGIMIIDEEHTTTYKQENTPKYHALDIAKWRSTYHKCPVVLGSATPSLESYARALKGVYYLIEMKERVNQKPLPEVKIIDLNTEKKKKTENSYFSNELWDEMTKRIENNEQIMLLLNRRGYSSIVSCQNCGYVEKCPHCDISLTYHKTSGVLRCHYCGYAKRIDTICPECKEEALKNLGVGTERIEEELKKYFPTARVVRMDMDTTSRKGAHEKIITAFQNHEYDILLGTQMIAKGLDFKEVTLVGIINADTSLNIPDFRSSEYTFQLLSQTSGRSGRGDKEGKVYIQTFNPDHYAIYCAKNHDYVSFYKKEMEIRHTLGYPPYYYLVLVKIISKDYSKAQKESTKIGDYLKRNLSEVSILGPSMANVFKMNNQYRFQIVLKYKRCEKLYPVLKELINHYQSDRLLTVDIDFNPVHF